MKKISLLIPVFCILSFQPVNAQFEKGKIMASVVSSVGHWDFGTDIMSIGFGTNKTKYSDGSKSDTDKSFGISLLPRVGYFIIDNLALGVDLQAGFWTESYDEGDSRYTESSMTIGPFVRYYYPLETIYPFVEANIGFGFYKEKSTGESDYDYKEGLFTYGIGVGAAKTLGQRVMIDAMLGYNSQIWKQEDDDKDIWGAIGLKVGLTLFFGQSE